MCLFWFGVWYVEVVFCVVLLSFVEFRCVCVCVVVFGFVCCVVGLWLLLV